MDRRDVLERVATAKVALDVGGWHRPINQATHVIDILPYETRLQELAWDPAASERFSERTWSQRDICDRTPWPYPDNFFDFAVCSHVLEDVRDPIWVVNEISRVSRAGYLECPNPAYELLSWRGKVPWPVTRRGSLVGNSHHRWLVDFDEKRSRVTFRGKSHDLDLKKLSVHYSSLHKVDYSQGAYGMEWNGTIDATEEIFHIHQWVESIVPRARELIEFSPIRRLLQALRERGRSAEPMQPEHSQKNPYPYV